MSSTTDIRPTAAVNLSTVLPDPYAAMREFGKAVHAAGEAVGLPPRAVELVKIRASQLNGCAHCLRMHVRDALRLGESTDRIAVIPAWRETRYFTPLERAALEVAEQVTHLGEHTDTTETDAAGLTDEQIAALRWAAIVINSWNRIAVTSHYDVAP